MFWKRLLSGIVLLLAAIGFFYVGGPLLLASCLIISLVGQNEFYKAIGIEHKALSVLGYMLTLIYYVLVLFEGRAYMTAVIVVSQLLFMTAYVATFPEYKTEEITGAFFGMCYVSVLLSFVYLTRTLVDGIYFVWLILVCAWGNDTLAYCTGMLLGKHKMVPKLSPKKSWEGFFGGVIGAGILGLIYGLIFGHRMNTICPELVCAIACAVGAVISTIGDLAASAIKRNHDIKDFGNLIPGHGGVLDRFDSVLFAAPAVYYAILLSERFF